MAQWYDDLLPLLRQKAQLGPLILNDAKTPSGRVHVGSLRGVLLHDAITKLAKSEGLDATFYYELDDMDPMDGLPSEATEELKSHMGKPLCKVPSPVKGFSDMADYYGSEFLNLFEPLGVEFRLLRARELYAEGFFNEAIDKLLTQSKAVKEAYFEVNGSVRSENWHPLQVICERCGKLGTTEVSAYENGKVRYHCRTDLVKWAVGCDYQGEISPFDGRAKLPWKVEWPAKWTYLGVSLEGAGKDHTTKGGSRDVAAAVAKRVFQIEPPLGMPYEFFLMGGSKMSSSKGIGVSSSDIVRLLPKEAIRFLMLKSPPRRAVDFNPNLDSMIKLYNELDKLEEAIRGGQATDEQKRFWRLCTDQDTPLTNTPTPAFSLLLALLQMPHLDPQEALGARIGRALTQDELQASNRRLASVRDWVKHFADPAELWTLQTSLPESIQALSESQRAFLGGLSNRLADRQNAEALDEEGYQSLLFDVARATPIPMKDAFEALYCAFFDRNSGPKGGALITFLGPQKISEHLAAVRFDLGEHYQRAACSLEELQKAQSKAKLRFDEAKPLEHANLTGVWMKDAHERSWFYVLKDVEPKSLASALSSAI